MYIYIYTYVAPLCSDLFIELHRSCENGLQCVKKNLNVNGLDRLGEGLMSSTKSCVNVNDFVPAFH